MNKIFDWHRYNRFIFALSVTLRIDCESDYNVDYFIHEIILRGEYIVMYKYNYRELLH